MVKNPPPRFFSPADLRRHSCRAISCLWYCSWERPREEEISKGEKKGLFNTLLMLAKDMRSTFYLRVFRKHLGMYLCGFGAEWLFASIFTYFVIFVLQHDPAMVAGLTV
ncbi:putative oligogalacturonide transporter [Klebsiella michiganensis]|uniref:Putative oligogalacturonide transporter n=1 Tax=Klebsiella michiganensis TaxID=1134687 RepID=A0A7H4MWA4_9ENTR|nr:putative oligogalacturonide transporter [Klebsiella michiganensis]